MPQLRDPQLERTQPGVETALAIPVAIVEPIGATLVPAGADQAFDIGPPLVLVLDATHHDDPKIARFPGHIQQ